MARYPGLFTGLAQRCHRCWKVIRGFYKDSPLVFVLVLSILLLIVLLVVLFSACIKRFVGMRGAIAVDLALFWLLARFVARVLMFPGSLKLFQRNTEASFRTEMSRQYAQYIRQLWTFLRHASRQTEGALRGISPEGLVRGCAVVETLTASFRMQEQLHEVKLSKEQELFQGAAQDVQRWLAGARVVRPSFGFGTQAPAQEPLVDWLRQVASGATRGLGPLAALTGAELAGSRDEAARGIERLEQLLGILDELRCQKKSLFGNTMRFFQVPTVGSLNQLRTELQMRYGGHRCWVPNGKRHRLDAMFLPHDGQPAWEDERGREDAPLNEGKAPVSFAGPVLVCCNPNAAYYETMLYQVSWLDFWLSRGVNLFLFNYAGYGRSSGKPSPGRIADDGQAIIRFLQSKGATQIGVYGRSIGGVAACHLARHNPDAVQLLIADRTMSTLENAAKYIYGSWASRALRATSMVASNVENFWEVRAHKVLVVDPKDTMILDLASLRTAVALRAVERLPASERLAVEEAALTRLEEAWRFFGLLFAICESEDDFGFEGDARSARQPNFFAREEPRSDCRLKVGEGSAASPGAPPAASGYPAERLVSPQWLEENAGLVRGAMAPLADQVRSALDVVGEHLEGGGVTLSDVFAESGPGDACGALRSMLANLQVWGTLGDQREDGELSLGPEAGPGGAGPYPSGLRDGDLEHFLRKEGDGDYPLLRGAPQRLAELGRLLAPEMITVYHRRLTRSRVGQIQREFRRRLGALQHAFTHASGGEAQAGEQSERLLRTALHHLGEVESFVSTLSRFFKSVDLAAPYSRSSDAPQEPPQQPQQASSSCESPEERGQDANPQPAIDHSLTGYIVHIDCGHNGPMDEVDMRQLALHVRAARFGQDFASLS